MVLINDVRGRKFDIRKDPFRRTYGLADFGITADVTVQAGDFGKVGELIIPAL